MKNETVKPKVKQKSGKKNEVEKFIQENVELNDKYLRLVAEMQNIMKRNELEKQNILKYDGEEFIIRILDIVDDFERAITLDDNNLDDEVSKFLEGFKLIYANLLNILKEYEVTEIECLGKEFDPMTMNAVMTDSVIEEEPNIVLDVMQKGYMYKDKVIRVAMVKVNE